MGKTQRTTFFLVTLFALFLSANRSVSAQMFGFNVHSLASDTPENISSILSFLSQNCQSNIIRFWGFENRGGYDNIQKVLDAAPSGTRFIIALEDFPYGPAEPNPKSWFSSGYKSEYRPYVQKVVSRYAGNPKILAWEIMNEPHCKGDASCINDMVSFMDDISTLIRSIDSSALVSPGLMALNHTGEEFGNGYDKITSLPNITANSCHFYDGNTSNCLTALRITKNKGKFFYVGEAGYLGNGSGSEGSCTSSECKNVCDKGTLQNRANVAQSNLSQLATAGIDAFIVWQFSPEGSPLLICDKFSVFPHDPICKIDAGLPYKPPPSTSPKEGCDLNNPGTEADQKTSRPVPCEKCNQTNKMTSSCATSFQVNDQVKYIRHESDNVCQNQHWLEKTWTGTVIVDPTQTTIPFVGKKGDENENEYLADYFEGTGFYYKPPYDLSKKEDIERVFKEGGVWRKLSPKETQDRVKEAMVYRAIDSKRGVIQEGVIRDYLVSYNGESARLSEFRDHFPPKPDEKDYDVKIKEWENSKWGRLWPAVPMFTREDTPGKIMPYLGAGVKDIFEIQDKEKSEIEKVPHLARLFEVTRAINQILLPAAQKALGQTNIQNNPVVAAAKDNSFSQKSLLAAADCQNCLVPSIVNPSVSGGLLHYSLQICPSCSGYGTIGDVRMGACGDLSQVQSVAPGCFSSDHPAIAPPIPISCPGTATICENAQANRDVAPSCASRVVSTSCQVAVDAKCKIISSSCGAAPPPPPACGLPKPQDVNTCKRQSLTGDGDTICCSKIQAKLSAVDQFVNPVFEECEYASDGALLNPSCNREEKYDVNRKIGVALSHPYLEEIWNYSTNSIKGFFNLFRPHERPEFEATDASSRIRYDYISNSGKGSASPAEGDFYYPYLGGTQKAKEWVIRTLLPSTRTPTAASNVPSSDQLGYSIDITDTNQTIKDITRANVISAVKASWPNTKIEEKWDYVFQRAKESGFNPVFVLAIWIEESGASGVNAYDLGIEACNPNDLEDQLNCFSKITYKDTSFEEFMCMFAEGKHHVCRFEKAVNFPGNLKYWYDALTK